MEENLLMKYMDVKTASEKWGITGRRIRILCNDGRIDGALRNGWSWLIPEDAPKPGDGRVMRRFRNLDIRPGFVDVEALEEARKGKDTESAEEDFLSLLPNTISFLFKGEGSDVSPQDVATVLSGELCYSLSLEEHLLIVNFRSILKGLFSRKDKWNGVDLKETYLRLVQGILDSDGEYEEREEQGVTVQSMMESVMKQYEDSWSMLHPLSSAAILSGEIMRLKPYSKCLGFLCYLVLSGEMLRGNFLPPLGDPSLLDEGKAAFSLVYGKGIYTDITALLERLVMRSYGEVGKNV